MNHPYDSAPEDGGNFPELERTPAANMEDDILGIVIEALNRQGYPGLDIDSIRQDPTHRTAVLAMLDDCRPLPVIRELARKIEQGRL